MEIFLFQVFAEKYMLWGEDVCAVKVRIWGKHQLLNNYQNTWVPLCTMRCRIYIIYKINIFLAFPSGNVQPKFRPDLQRPCWCSRWSEECGVTELWLRDAILSPLKKIEIKCTGRGNQLICPRVECGRSHILQTAGWTASYVSHLSESSAVSTLPLQLGNPRLTGLT